MQFERIRPSSKVVTMTLGLAIAVAGSSQVNPPAKEVAKPVETKFALTNVRIESPSGTLFKSGVIAWENGRIVSIGADAPKGDFKVLDGKGAWVYPGMIEPFLNRGSKPPAQTANDVIDNTTTAPAFMRPLNRNGIRPELNPDEYLDLESVIAPLNEAGYVAAGIAPASGTIRGTLAATSLREGKREDILLKAKVAMVGAYTPGGLGGYPATEIGITALMRQTFYDSQRLLGVSGKDAPKEAAVLNSLGPVMDGRMPLAMIANSQYQIIRTLEFKAQFGFKLWLAGVTGANDMPMEMIPKDVEMIVSLTQRREPTNEGDTKVPDPVFAERKATYEKSLRNFADLESAGFKPSITAAGVTPNQIWGNLRNWVRVGASKSSILEAMTSRPAALLGISKEVGSLEVGKRAHIAVFDGDPFAEKTKMKMIVVDGVVKNLGGEK